MRTRNEGKNEFSAICEIDKTGIAKNGPKMGMVEHSKEQELESRKICQKF